MFLFCDTLRGKKYWLKEPNRPKVCEPFASKGAGYHYGELLVTFWSEEFPPTPVDYSDRIGPTTFSFSKFGNISSVIVYYRKILSGEFFLRYFCNKLIEEPDLILSQGRRVAQNQRKIIKNEAQGEFCR